MSSAARLDGRWLAAALVLLYALVIATAGSGEARAARWRQAGVYAYPAPFIDLQVFPAARATVAAGGELYGPSVTDPMQRPYNYPRVWLAFMRFPAEPGWLRTLGVLQAGLAVGLLLVFWRRLTPGEGLFGGLLLCSPAFQLGVERGNTDLTVLALVAGGLLVPSDGARRRGWAGFLWGAAAVLKLYPIAAFVAWFDGGWRTWLRRAWLPFVLFAGYVAWIWSDLVPVLRNTGFGWVQSFGSEVTLLALHQAESAYKVDLLHGLPAAGTGRWIALAAVAGILLWRRQRLLAGGVPGGEAEPRAEQIALGFRVAALIYLGTFLAGSSFDYRQCFLLLALPQLFAWHRAGRTLATAALVALLLSMGTNFLLAGWTGFVANELAGWALLVLLTWLLTATWGPREESRA